MTAICLCCDNIVLTHVLVPLIWYFFASASWYVQAEGQEELIVTNHDVNQKGSAWRIPLANSSFSQVMDEFSEPLQVCCSLSFHPCRNTIEGDLRSVGSGETKHIANGITRNETHLHGMRVIYLSSGSC